MKIRSLSSLVLVSIIALSPSAFATDIVISTDTDLEQDFTSGPNSIYIHSGITLSNGSGSTAINQVYTSGPISITNNGTISSNAENQAAIFMGNTGSLLNNGAITFTGANGFGLFINYGSNNTTITNLGLMTGEGYGSGIYGGFCMMLCSIVGTLNNLQGGNSLSPATTALTLQGNLPTNYNIIINSSQHYGQLAVSSVSRTTVFGISSLSTAGNSIIGVRLANVLTGLAPSNIANSGGSSILSSGDYITVSSTNGYSGNLFYEGSNNWDLTILSIPGPSSADTQVSLHSLAPKLRSGFNSQAIATNFANMNTYDCDLFDAKGVCVSVGGQQTDVDNPSAKTTSAVLVAGYKISPQIRIGGFLNQNINNNTVSSVHISNANPLMGLFAVWNQNENRLGYQVKVANAYQDKDLTTTRDVMGTSEAGTGSTTLNTQSYVGELSYAFLVNQDKTLLRPYAALRYTRVKQDGYTESSSISTPLTFAAIEDRSTTTLVGVKLIHKLAEKVNLTGSIGIEQDIDHHVDKLSATGVSDLTSENFNDSIKRTRPVASIGAYYMPVKNQRIAGELFYQQLPFRSTAAVTAYVNYTIGF